MNPYEIIRRPHVSEKSVHLQNKIGAYTFDVHPHANKVQIKEAIKSLWKVDVVAAGSHRRVEEGDRTPGCRPEDRGSLTWPTAN
jgi:large subunit ribosomal protein L23